MFSRVFVTNRGTSHHLPMFLPVYQPHRLTGLLDGWANGPAIDGCIVNAYFLYKQRDLKRRLMTEQDLHDYLSFQRLVATDSGAFQGFTRRGDLKNADIVRFQDRIGSDVLAPSRPSTSTTTTRHGLRLPGPPRPRGRVQRQPRGEPRHAGRPQLPPRGRLRGAPGIFGSIDANRGDYQNGWDTDQFPNSVDELSLRGLRDPARRAASRPAASTSTPSSAGRASAGRTCSTPISAAWTRSPSRCSRRRTCSSGRRSRSRLAARYAGWDGALGRSILDGSASLADLAAKVEAEGIDPKPVSGGQELLEASSTADLGGRLTLAGPAQPMSHRPGHRHVDDGDEGRPRGPAGNVAGIGTAEYGFDAPRPAWSEQDPACGGPARSRRSGAASPRPG